MMNKIGILQGRLTPSNGRGIQFFPDENWQNEFETAKKIGFDCIELLVKKENLEGNPLFSEKGRKEISRLKDTYKIETPSVHGFYSKESDYKGIMVELVKNAQEVGAKTILVSFFKDSTLKTDADKKLAREQLAQAIKVAEAIGSRIAIEAEMLAPELKDLIKSFNSGAVGAYYDIGNMVSMNANVIDEIKFLGPLLFGVHIKDRTKNAGGTVPIGTGDGNFLSTLKALKESGYNGPLILQGARSETVDDINLNTKYFEYIKNILKTL